MRNLNRVHLNGLRAAESVGRLGSLARAAEEMGVTPGAVSQQLVRLERQLGRALFSRETRGLALTPFGAAFLARLTAGFQTLEDALALAFRHEENVLTISVAPVFASKWLVPRLNRFTAAHPGLSVRLDASVELKSPDGSDIDLCIRVGDGRWPGVAKELLLPQEVFPVCAPAFAEKLKQPSDLLDLAVVADANSNLSWDLWLAPHGLNAADLKIAYSFTDASLALDAAVAGLGVLLGWQTLAHDAIRAGQLTAPLPGRANTGFGYWLISSAQRRDTAAAASFRRWIVQELGETARAFA
ncbi:MAG TPA: LysR substrate-binding domain-containing protein [Mesorhizobium sp.]|nr:LysR substrate-binding domain-containing protein [Mesorhizobium sp.]